MSLKHDVITATSAAIPQPINFQSMAVAIVTGAIVTVVAVVCVVAIRQRRLETRLRRHALKQSVLHPDRADLLELGTIDVLPSDPMPPPVQSPRQVTRPRVEYQLLVPSDPTPLPPEREELVTRFPDNDGVTWKPEMGFHAVSESRSCYRLDRRMPTSGPGVIIARQSGRTSGCGTGNDRFLEPITVAGETTFPVHPEMTSATRLRDPEVTSRGDRNRSAKDGVFVTGNRSRQVPETRTNVGMDSGTGFLCPTLEDRNRNKTGNKKETARSPEIASRKSKDRSCNVK